MIYRRVPASKEDQWPVTASREYSPYIIPTFPCSLLRTSKVMSDAWSENRTSEMKEKQPWTCAH